MAKVETLNALMNSRKTRGRWQLDKRHRLLYVYDEDTEQGEIGLEAALVAAEADALIAAVSERQKNGKTVTRTARLEGSWRANEKNQLEFEIERSSGAHDVLTFRGAWKIGKAQEIIYTWRRTALKTRTRSLETLTFKGWWDVTKDHRLTYTLQGARNETFRLTGTFQTRSILAKKGELRYQLGASLEGRRRGRVLTLFGKWKVSTALELVFEIDCADGRAHEMRFGAEFEIAKDFSVAARLTARDGEPLGAEIIFSKEFLKSGAQGFVRLRKTLRESAVETGVTIPW